MKVAIIGSRHFGDFQLLEEAIYESGFNITEECCGKADGADTLGEIWASKLEIPVTPFPAAWSDLEAPGAIIKINRYGEKYNAKAGHDRNTRMISYADAVIALWDGISPGTRHAIREAKRLNKPIFVKYFGSGDHIS